MLKDNWQSTRVSLAAAVSLLVAVALILVLLGVLLTAPSENGGRSLRETDSLQKLSQASSAVSEAVGPSVVRIEVERDGTALNDELKQLFGDRATAEATQGSGVVLSSDGLILTNYHVVAGASSVTVVISDERREANLLGADALTDLAVVHVGATSATPIVWGDSSQVAVGDLVWAIGNPFGLRQSVTFGIVSAVEQDGDTASPLKNFMQTDAAVNPGCSGGPIINAAGEVIGINTAIVGQSFRGISFAIPSNTARSVAASLSETGRVRRGWIGVRLADPNTNGSGVGRPVGAVVAGFSGSAAHPTPAQTAGVKVGDLVVKWDQVDILDTVQLARLVAASEIGASVPVQVMRDGTRLTLDMVIDERP